MFYVMWKDRRHVGDGEKQKKLSGEGLVMLDQKNNKERRERKAREIFDVVETRGGHSSCDCHGKERHECLKAGRNLWR